ncbi:MAG: hypothetical protein OXU64_13545 [Gemmatimonadota bacterium]|nr:hypothetical protein [Gemmatimonadota bacterium]
MRRAIVNLGEDMSFLGMRIATLADEMDRSSAAIGWLKEQVALLSRSAGAWRARQAGEPLRGAGAAAVA